MLILFACKDPFPLYKSSKTRNHLKRENLERLFLLAALKMPIKSVTSYQAEEKKKIFRRHLTLFWFLDFATLCSYLNIEMCSYLTLEIKSFVSLKNESFFFWTRVHFKGGVKFSKLLRGLIIKEGEVGSDRFKIFLRGGGLGEKWWGQYFRVQLIA